MNRTDLVVSWIVALTFVLAGLWPLFSASQTLLPGFEAISSHGAVAKWAQIVTVLFAVLWISIAKWHSRDRFLIFRGIALALVVQGFLYISVPFALGFVVLHNVAVRAGK